MLTPNQTQRTQQTPGLASRARGRTHQTVALLPRRIGARIPDELRSALPPTIFFFVGFNFIVLTRNLLVADYGAGVSNFMLATLAALVVGKAVITANATPFVRLFDRAPLSQPILFKTAVTDCNPRQRGGRPTAAE